MNLYLPYGESFCKNLACLDDQTLREQIADCYTVLTNFMSNSHKKPQNKFYKHYYKYIAFLAEYGRIALLEFHYRFNFYHKLTNSYEKLVSSFSKEETPRTTLKIKLVYFKEIEIKNNTVAYIIKTKAVNELYQRSLKEKWLLQLKKRPSLLTWTNRPIPTFFNLVEASNKIRHKT